MTIPVILVDDNEADRYLIGRSIEECGIDCSLHTFCAGDDFLEAFTDPETYATLVSDNSLPAMILLDINMPRLSGFEVLEELSKIKQQHENFVVLMVTSSSNDKDREQAEKYSFVKDFSTKPIEEKDIVKLIEKHYPNFDK